MAMVEIVIALALLQLVYFSLRVGAARGKYQVQAPATTGNPMFERHYRVQMNTLEMIVVFIPAIWLFGLHISPLWAALIGVIYLAGRFLYEYSYVADPSKRSAGFGLSFLPTLVLLLGGLGGAVMQALGHF